MTERLRVGMNLLWLRPAVVGGSEVAATSTVDALTRCAGSEIDLRLYAQPAFRRAHPELTTRVETRTVRVPGSTRPARVALEWTWLPRAVQRDRIDVVHCYGGVVPPGLGRPSVLTLHDVQPLEAGAAFGAVKKRWLARAIPASVAGAAVVTVPSAFVRDRVLEMLDVDEGKVVVVPHGMDAAMTVDPQALPDPAAVRRRFRLAGPFIVYLAITYPHKNHEMLIRAFARLARERGQVTLVLAGGAGSAEASIVRLVERLGVGDRVRRVGRISTVERDVLVREASMVGVPSRYEGFGLPVLEAFATDTPVVASSAGSLPEVVGDAGVLVDPDDLGGWVDAMRAAVDGAFASPEASARRAARAETYRWDRLIPQLCAVYRRAAALGGSRR